MKVVNMTLDQMLDEADLLPKEDLFIFNDVLNNRVRELKRQELLNTVEQSRYEYETGQAKSSSVKDIMNEIMS